MDLKFRAYIKTIKWMLPVEQINFNIETVEVDLTSGYGDYAEYEFDEVELMQYTGLKDKNGNKIYEGDIVSSKCAIEQPEGLLTHEQVGEILTDKGMTCFNGKTKRTYKNQSNIYDSRAIFLSSDIYEVIGNIYENPEMLDIS